MPQFNSKYNTEDLVEFNGESGKENQFGFIKGVKFHRYDAVNHAALYTIHLVNSEKVVDEVTEQDIVRQFHGSPAAK